MYVVILHKILGTSCSALVLKSSCKTPGSQLHWVIVDHSIVLRQDLPICIYISPIVATGSSVRELHAHGYGARLLTIIGSSISSNGPDFQLIRFKDQ